MFGPGFATGLAASSNAQDILLKQAEQRARVAAANEEMQAAQRQRMGQALVAEALQKVLGGAGQIPTQFTPARTSRTPAPPPRAPAGQTKGAGAGAIQIDPIPAPGASNEGTTIPGAIAPVTAQGVQPAPGAAAPASPQDPQAGAPVKSEPQATPPQAGRQRQTWRSVLEEIVNRTDVDPNVKFAAYEQVQKEIANEEKRESDAYQKELDRQAKLYQQLQVLEARYRMAGTNEAEKMRLKSQYDLVLAELNNTSREKIAGMNIGSRERIAAANNASREGMAQAKLEYQKQFDAETLDLKADSQVKNYLLKSRQLDLQEKGMNSKEAQFYAKLEQDKAIADLRDATTRRGQDMMNERVKLAAEQKLTAEEAKVASTLPLVIDGFDKIYETASEMINEPGLDAAVGPISQYLLTVRDDTADFEAKLTLLKSLVGFKALADMRAASPTGGALGNVSNKEVEFLQNTVAALSLAQSSEQFIESLRKIMDNANKGKALTLQAYERRFGAGKPAGGDVSTASTTPKPGGETRDIPTELQGEPEGTIVKDGAKTFVIQQGKLVETGG